MGRTLAARSPVNKCPFFFACAYYVLHISYAGRQRWRLERTNQMNSITETFTLEGKRHEITLTEQSRELFFDYLKDACNWSGEPLVGGNVGRKPSNKGNLTDLKRKGLVTTWAEDYGDQPLGARPCSWLKFTTLGYAYAKHTLDDLADFSEHDYIQDDQKAALTTLAN